MCGARRPALGRAAGAVEAPCRPEHAVETVLHAVEALVQQPCEHCGTAGVFCPAGDGDEACPVCNGVLSGRAETLAAVADRLARRLALPARVNVTDEERQAATMLNQTPREWLHGYMITSVRRTLGHVGAYRDFGAREQFVDMFARGLKKYHQK